MTCQRFLSIRVTRIVFALFLFTGTTVLAQQVPDLLPVKENNLWGLIDRNGNIRLSPSYGYLSTFDLNGYAICEINGKKGLLDTSATVRLNAAYDLITCLNSQFYLLMNDSLWQFYDLSSSVLSDTFLCEGMVIPVSTYAFKAREGRLWGLIDKGGNWVVRPLYDEITSVSSCISLRMNDSILLLDSNYNEILSGKFEVAYADKGVICTRNKQNYRLFSDKGEEIISDLDRITFYNSYITIGQTGKTGVFCLPSHTLVSEPLYDSIFYVDDRYWGFMETGKCGILDSLGKIIIPGIYNKIRYIQGFFCLRNGENWGIAGESGKIILECLYESISLIDRNLIEIEKNSLYGLANTSGKILVNCSAGRIIYRDGMAKIYRDSIVTIAEISRDGEITGKTVCKSVGTISIDEDNTRRPVFSTNNSLSAVEKSWGSWFFSEERKKYGLKNNTDEVIITPRYGEVHVNNNLRLTLTEAKRRQDNITLSGAILSENLPKYGLVDHIRGKILQPAVWEKIYINDLNLGYRFIRCAKTVRSRMSCIRPFDNGAVFQENVLFTGKISDSLIRVCIGGNITLPYTHPRESISVSGTGLAGFSSFDGRRSSATMIYIENGRWFFWDTNGYQAVNGDFSFADDFINGTAIVKKDNKWGVTNRDTVIVPFEYDNITRLAGSDDSLFILYLRKWNCGVLDDQGNILFKSNYQDVRYANDGFLLIKEGNKWGYAELTGTIVVNPVFSKAGVFSEGLAPVKSGRMWGYINTDGDVAIEPSFSRAGEFHEGLAWVKTSRKSGYIDPYGNFAIEGKYTSGSDFHNGMAIVSQKMKFGVIDKKGNWLVKPRYRYVSGFSEGMAVFSKNKKCFFADSTGKRMIKGNFEDAHPFYDGLAAAKNENKWGYIDKTGKWVIQPEFDRVRDFSEEGIAIVGKSIRYGIVDKKGNYIVPVKYRYISEFGSSGYALVKIGPQKYNYIKQDGNLLLNKDVFYALPFNGNTAVIRTSGISDLQLIDIYGKPVTREIYIYLSALDDRHYCYKTPYVCGIADLSGTILIKPENESIKYERSGLYRIENGNKLGYYDERKADWIWSMRW